MKYSPFKKTYTLYYATEYDLQKAADLIKSKFTTASVTIGNSKHDRQAEADRTAVIRDIPLSCRSETIKQYFAKYGDITRFSMTTLGLWQRAYVVYKESSTINQLKTDVWSINILDFSVRVHPLNLSKDEFDEREAYALKLTGLPFGTTQHDLQHIIQDTNAKTCYIPKNAKTYRNLPIAILGFDCDDRAHAAYDKNYTFKGRKLYWNVPGIPNCRTCGNPDHVTNQCPHKSQRPRNSFNQLYDRFKPAQYRSKVTPPPKVNNTRSNKSYAETAKSSSSTASSSQSSPNNSNVSKNQKQPSSNQRPLNSSKNKSIDNSPHISQETINQLVQGFAEIKQDLHILKHNIKTLQAEQMNLESRVLKLEECYYDFEDTPPQHYDLDQDMAFSFTQHIDSSVRSNIYSQENNSSSSSSTTHIQLQDLVDRNSLLENKLEKMMTLMASLQPSTSPSNNPLNNE